MNILVTGATGYIGKRLIPLLVGMNHQVICVVRDKERFLYKNWVQEKKIILVELDFLNPNENYKNVFKHVDVAFYLIHSLSSYNNEFENLEQKCAQNFLSMFRGSSLKQIIFLSGIVNNDTLSPHLSSRKKVEDILMSSSFSTTVLRAGIIVGSGSASFEIIRDLTEKLPVMVAPSWLKTPTQPIAIRNVLSYLISVINLKNAFNKSFDIGDPEVLTYRKLIEQYAEVRGLKRLIFTLPFLSPKLSSYWLYFVTSTSFPLAQNLVDSMKVPVIASESNLAKEIDINLLTYKEAVSLAFQKIRQRNVASSWKDAMVSSNIDPLNIEEIEVPEFGCFTDTKQKIFDLPKQKIINQIWSLGGEKGWFYGNWLWQIRGFIDKFFGGVGLRRGRTNISEINPGDALDFWRVLVADKQKGKLLLYAEMKLPGEAWLEFKILEDKQNKKSLVQTATFRPKGILGRLYWLAVLPFHYFIFNGMINNIIKAAKG
jgi:uncharacterized protein YbjT (DUF2867 family)